MREGDNGRVAWRRRKQKGKVTENSEASGGKYSRFQANRVMTQFRKDR